ncbi:MAG: 1-acyl-sn-glycerol-3-phosphate acyltransferase [Bacteroidetes bacterium]|nr:1-acyl-sn-glycerol-3-phosphate acyltransferase [Bacteroidota bacterium]
MISWLSRVILRFCGWRTSGVLPPGIKKAILIVAPHTSYWDFVIGRLTFWASGVKIKVLIKKEVFVGPAGWFLKRMGSLPVDRGKKNFMIDQLVQQFDESDSLIVVITPEGTRRLVKQWKKGFYLIAQAANVPIALAYIDYKEKSGGVGPIIYPTGNYEKDMVFIQDFYRDKTGKHPELFNLSKQVSTNQHIIL